MISCIVRSIETYWVGWDCNLSVWIFREDLWTFMRTFFNLKNMESLKIIFRQIISFLKWIANDLMNHAGTLRAVRILSVVEIFEKAGLAERVTAVHHCAGVDQVALKSFAIFYFLYLYFILYTLQPIHIYNSYSFPILISINYLYREKKAYTTNRAHHEGGHSLEGHLIDPLSQVHFDRELVLYLRTRRWTCNSRGTDLVVLKHVSFCSRLKSRLNNPYILWTFPQVLDLA